MLVRKESKVRFIKKEGRGRKMKRRCEGISNALWKQIETDMKGYWYWNGKKINRDDFWDYVWEEFNYYCEENGLDSDKEDFDAWCDAEDLDDMLKDVFYNAGREYVDYNLDSLCIDLKRWMMDNIAGEVISSLSDVDFGELREIFDKADKLKDVEGVHVKHTSLKDVMGKLKDIIDDCGSVRFTSKVESDSYYDGYYCVGYGTDGTSMYELAIDLHD